MRQIFIIALIFCLTGCATFVPWTEMNVSEYADKSQGFSATIPRGWMRFNRVGYFIITRDGTALENIAVARHKIDKKLEFTKKMFSKDMTVQDLAEIEIDDYLANNDISKFEVISNQPATIDGRQACRIEYTLVTGARLKVRGIHYGFVYKDWVFRIHYEAANQHYFKKYLGDFERFIVSFKVTVN